MNLTLAAGRQDLTTDLTTAHVLAASALLLMQQAAYFAVEWSRLVPNHDPSAIACW